MSFVRRCLKKWLVIIVLLAPWAAGVQIAAAADQPAARAPTDEVTVRLEDVLLRIPFVRGVTLIPSDGDSFIQPPRDQKPHATKAVSLSHYLKKHPGPVELTNFYFMLREFCRNSSDAVLCKAASGRGPSTIASLTLGLTTSHSTAFGSSLNVSQPPDFSRDKEKLSGLEIAIVRGADGTEFDCHPLYGDEPRRNTTCYFLALIGQRTLAALRLSGDEDVPSEADKNAYREAFIETIKSMKIN
jgi:hypothetical protein